MTFSVKPLVFRRWLRRALRSNVSKNNVRKELGESLYDLLEDEPSDHSYLIPSRHYVALVTFFNLDGRGENLPQDSLLNFINTCVYLLQRLEESSSRAVDQQAAPVEAQSEHSSHLGLSEIKEVE